MTADNGHSEATESYQRCLRILRRWTVPDRSSKIADSSSSEDYFAHLFINHLDDPKVSPDLITSIQRVNGKILSGLKVIAEWAECELPH
jgi:hypothetical protein